MSSGKIGLLILVILFVLACGAPLSIGQASGPEPSAPLADTAPEGVECWAVIVGAGDGEEEQQDAEAGEKNGEEEEQDAEQEGEAEPGAEPTDPDTPLWVWVLAGLVVVFFGALTIILVKRTVTA